MSLRLVSKFANVSLQGLPVSGFRRFGVPPGGALDQESLMLANGLLRLEPETPGFEVLGGLSELVAEEDCTLAVVGANTDLPVSQGSFRVSKGERLKIGLGASGFAYYLTWSTALLKPQKLDLRRESTSLLRVVAGPQSELFPRNWHSVGFTVSNRISRAGFRLSGGLNPHSFELPSEPACCGAIQITPDGTAIILGPDGPTIGGYPKVAVVCSADLDMLAHLRPGSNLEFELISLEAAQTLRQSHRAEVARRVAQLRLGND